MIKREFYTFLSELKENNSRDWFHENKASYDSLRTQLVHLAEILIVSIGKFDQEILGLQPKQCIFRINRDIRFSKDKSPYKTNMGMFFAPGGRNAGKAGYYLHIEPNNSFIAGGIYMPPSPFLKAIRQEIFDNYEEFIELINHQDFRDTWGGLELGDSLKTKPRGYPDNFEGMEYLRLKSFTVINFKKDEAFLSSDFLESALQEFEVLSRLNKFINQIEY